MKIKTYSELVRLPTFEERFEYLKLYSTIGVSTFGNDRYLNQILYNSSEWRSCRNKIILRDNGCDLGLEDYPIFKRIHVHHLNPITVEEVIERDPKIFDPEFLISTSEITHKSIHYDSGNYEPVKLTVRTKFDTCPWKERI